MYGVPYRADLDSCKERALRQPLFALSGRPDDPEEVEAIQQHRASETYAVVSETPVDVATSVATFEAGKEP